MLLRYVGPPELRDAASISTARLWFVCAVCDAELARDWNFGE